MSTTIASPALVKNLNKAKNYLPDIKAKGVQAICFFNNKGGVGKTTLVANLAAQMALRGC